MSDASNWHWMLMQLYTQDEVLNEALGLFDECESQRLKILELKSERDALKKLVTYYKEKNDDEHR